MSEQAAYDVFISYAQAESAWVRGELLPRLEQAGLRVCIDFRDFRPGAPAVRERERALQDSRKTLLILTPAYLASDWAEFESLMLQTLDPAARDRRLIPLLKAPCEPPLRIGQLHPVYFTDTDELDIAWTQLLTALGVPPLQQPPAEPAREQWRLAHPYAMPPNFTGRIEERTLLSDWLNSDVEHRLLVIRALGGFGKSALTWHWLLHDVDPALWPRVVWWSFYESDAGFDGFLQDTLEYLGIDPQGRGPRPQADELLRLLRQPGTLLIMDGFERALRVFSGMSAAYQGDEPLKEGKHMYGEPSVAAVEGSKLSFRDPDLDCVSPIAEYFLRSVATLPGIRGKVLMTTRLRPRALETHGDLLQGCREVELTQMQPADAVDFFRAQGVRSTRAEIEAACAPYGYHPLSLRLLAGLVVHDLRQPGDIAAAQRLDVNGDLVQRRHHVLEQAYEGLNPTRRQLLSRIACFRGAVGYKALHVLAQKGKDKAFDANVRDLLARGLLQHDRIANCYDLHPIVRRYAYERLLEKNKRRIHTRLANYFCRFTDEFLPERLRNVPEKLRVFMEPNYNPKAKLLDDITPFIERYYHTVRSGRYGDAWFIFWHYIHNNIYYHFGAYQLQVELLQILFVDSEKWPPQFRLRNKQQHPRILNALANAYSLSGHPKRAAQLYERANLLDKQQNDEQNFAIGLGNLACQRVAIGALRVSNADLHSSILLSRNSENTFSEAVGREELGRLMAYQGDWSSAEDELTVALTLFEREQKKSSQGTVWAYRAMRSLLLTRNNFAFSNFSLKRQHVTDPLMNAITMAHRSLELVGEFARTNYLSKRNDVRAHWLLGAAHRANGDTDEADRHLTEALTRCRNINLVEMEADILLDLARLRMATGDRDEALSLAHEALEIAERCGYVLQGADINLFLAERALEDGDEQKALQYAQEGRRLAACDGPPDYTYKVAYDEAGALLARLGAALEPLKD